MQSRRLLAIGLFVRRCRHDVDGDDVHLRCCRCRADDDHGVDFRTRDNETSAFHHRFRVCNDGCDRCLRNLLPCMNRQHVLTDTDQKYLKVDLQAKRLCPTSRRARQQSQGCKTLKTWMTIEWSESALDCNTHAQEMVRQSRTGRTKRVNRRSATGKQTLRRYGCTRCLVHFADGERTCSFGFWLCACPPKQKTRTNKGRNFIVPCGPLDGYGKHFDRATVRIGESHNANG
jgi:hypothetical protein